MTEPPDPEPIDPVADDAHDEVVEQLRARLRDEPIERDELARERRLRAALDAAPAIAPVPAPRRRAAAPWLAAAAVLVLVALGGVLFVAAERSGGGEDESADSGAEVATADADHAGTAAADESLSADGAGGAEEQQSTTTIAPAAATQEGAAISDLGEFPDAAALRAQLGAASDPPPTTRSAARFDIAGKAVEVSECIARQQATGTEVLAIASIVGAPVVVVRSPAGIELLAIPGCAPRPD